MGWNVDKPGTFNVAMGAAVFAIGAVVTAGTYSIALGGHFVVAYGAILVGGHPIPSRGGAIRGILIEVRGTEGPPLCKDRL